MAPQSSEPLTQGLMAEFPTPTGEEVINANQSTHQLQYNGKNKLQFLPKIPILSQIMCHTAIAGNQHSNQKHGPMLFWIPTLINVAPSDFQTTYGPKKTI